MRRARHGPVIVHCTDSEDFPAAAYRHEFATATVNISYANDVTGVWDLVL